jgi:bifunctional N-acetylglucosamine-1-phosphate-uridyltransferase/glucosamine-1-phosphate-acetyltransferase GlmU-like protein
MNKDRQLGAIILAAGKGKRMNTKNKNKVTLTLADKPLVKHSVDLLEDLQFHAVVVVIGYAKESVKEVLKNDTHIIFAEQKKRLGTAHAVAVGFQKITPDVTDVLVIQGDDSAFYTKDVIEQLAAKHVESNAAVTFLTVKLENPFALGRVVRDASGKVTAIVEEKDATEEQRAINEINAACYFFSTKFLKKYLKKIKKSPVTGEYYIVSLIEMAAKNKETIETMQVDLPWRGVNTQEELKEAEQLFAQLKK